METSFAFSVCSPRAAEFSFSARKNLRNISLSAFAADKHHNLMNRNIFYVIGVIVVIIVVLKVLGLW